MTQKKKVLVLTHAVMYEKGSIHGPAHGVVEVLKKYSAPVLIEHPLSGYFSSVLTQGRQRKRYILARTAGPKRWIIEMCTTILHCLRHRYGCIIAIDPLNALPVLLLHAVGVIPFFVYYTVDFADKRSSSVIQDTIYHWLDALAAHSADQCWAVSKRILRYRRTRQHIDARKLFFVPNVPPSLPKIANTKRRFSREIVLVSNLHKGIGFDVIIETILYMSAKYPDLRLHLIGDGDERTRYEQLLSRKRRSSLVHFHGRLTHDKVYAVLSKVSLGLALYTGHDAHRFYSDSMKARDYLANGIPVLISGDLGTAEEIEEAGAGKWIALTRKDLSKAIDTILASADTYAPFAKGALALGRSYHLEHILTTALEKILRT